MEKLYHKYMYITIAITTVTIISLQVYTTTKIHWLSQGYQMLSCYMYNKNQNCIIRYIRCYLLLCML